MSRDAARSRRMNEALTGWLFLLPFLATYMVFLVYPFFSGVWISLNEWNLLAVAFNPDARVFIGLENYVRLMWGTGMEWSATAQPFLQGLVALLAVALFLGAMRGRIRLTTAALGIFAALVLAFALGWAPGEDGRWHDRRFWPIVGNTVLFVALAVPAITAVSLVLAVALNRETRAMAVLRTVFFLSQILSVTVVTLIWQIMFSAQQGMIGNIVKAFGGTPIAWLTEPGFAMATIVIATIWWSIGIAMMLFLAGLQDIPGEIYEAAELDDSGPVQTFFYITLPNIKRTISVVAILQIILHFQVFGQAHLMTNGGPNDQTQVLVRYIYQTAFRDSDLGRAAAIAVFLFLIMAVFSILQFLVSRERGQ